ncbi:protein transport protein S31 [Massospora cicadina]|nr:protein transport protein S31 [Massospora cicadina]
MGMRLDDKLYDEARPKGSHLGFTVINRTVSVAWSPIQSCSAICTGTVAGALDETFSNTTQLEIFKLDWSKGQREEGELEPSGVVTTNARFNRLAWTVPTGEYSLGVIAGGMENGEIDFWDPAAILNRASTEGCLISRQSKHTGAVRGLDFNPLQPSLLASGAANGEVFIWNLGDLTKPYSPGAKSQKLEAVAGLAWNRKVQHILATSSTSGYTVIWDLKNRREVMNLGYQPNQAFGASGARGVTAVAWNPDSATQLVTASEDDNNPVVMLWDLRNANAPEKVFSGHSKGILSLSWCTQDPDLLLSCGKDNRTICWNPKLGEMVGEFPPSHNWSFDVQFCPRNPNLLSSSSYDGQVVIYSLLSSKGEAQPEPDGDPFSQAIKAPTAFALKDPPRWFRRPVGATFGFGGLLAYFSPAGGHRTVTLANVAVEQQLLQRSDELESALANDGVADFCEKQVAGASSDDDKVTWDILRLLFKEDSRNQLVQMLGVERNVSKAETEAVLTTLGIESTPAAPETPKESKEALADEEAKEDAVDSLFQAGEDKEDGFFSQTAKLTSDAKPFKINGDASIEGLLSKMVVVGDFSGAVHLCLQTARYADALIFAMCGGGELLTDTKREVFRRRRDEASYVRLLENVLVGDFVDVVQNADLGEWQKIVAMICTYAQGEEFSRLMETLGNRLHGSAEPSAHQHALLCFLLAGNLPRVVEIWVGGEQTPRMMDSAQLQSLIEKVAIFSQAIDFADGGDRLDLLYMLYYRYAALLASQGHMSTAAKYLGKIPSTHQGPTLFSLDDFSALKYRLYYAGVEVESIDLSAYPYASAEIGPPAYQAAYQPPPAQEPYPQPAYQPTPQPVQQAYPQPPYYGSYQPQPSYAPEPVQASAPPYDMASLYNPYPNYPPNPGFPAVSPTPAVVSPPSAQKGGPAWNDPPSEVFATQQAPVRPQTKAPILSPFGGSAPIHPPAPSPRPPFGATPSALPPPPQGGRAPAPLYKSSPQPARPPPQPMLQPSMPQAALPQQPVPPSPAPRQPMHQPPPRPAAPSPAQPPQRPLYQTSPAPPTRGNPPSPGAPQPNLGQPPRPQPVASPTSTPPKPQPAPIDRTKLPPKYQLIFDLLSKPLAAVKSTKFVSYPPALLISQPPAQQRIVADVDRRMTQLFEAMNTDQLPASLLEPLIEFAKALEAKDYARALNLHGDIVNRHMDQVGVWVLGLKHIVTLLRSMG